MQALYDAYYRLLIRIAYQLTGSMADAEDAVHDTFEKLNGINFAEVQNPKSYVCKMVTNRCLDMMKSARKQRETYIGEWLPEPILLAERDPSDLAEEQEVLSYAMLVLMETLSPMERIVFVYREAIGFTYPDIAEAVGKSEANCRKIFSRAKVKLEAASRESKVHVLDNAEWVGNFLQALQHGQVDAMTSMLKEDVCLTVDGGGKATAALRPIYNRGRVSRFFAGLWKQAADSGLAFQMETIDLNGEPAVLVKVGGEVTAVMLVQIDHHQAANLYMIRNPDKLRRISKVLSKDPR